MLASVRELNQQFVDLWWESKTSLPDLGPKYTTQAQLQNEKGLLQFLDQVEHLLINPPHNREDAKLAKLRLGAAFRCLAEETLAFTGTQLDLLPSEAFSKVSEEFVYKSRDFDSKLSMEDIYQAGRNVWTANGLQWLLGLPVQLTPSIFAYSLLYPYTDNYFDNPAIAYVTKVAFNERLRQRLLGDRLPPVNAQEQVIFDLVGMIENQYSRDEDTAVFESLLAIYDAQSESLNLLQRSGNSEDVDVLGLSFYKGGASVMADGYLAGGFLTGAQRQYTYGQGILAQLLDDMEDLEEDRRAGRLSIYTQPSGGELINLIANRTFQMGHTILKDLDCFAVDEPVRHLIHRATDLLLIDAIARRECYYPQPYLDALEAHSPYRFSFLKEQRSQFLRRHGPQGKLMEKFMLHGKF